MTRRQAPHRGGVHRGGHCCQPWHACLCFVLTRTREQSLRVEVGTIERGGRVCIIALQNTGSLRSTLTWREMQYLI
jgi:hypothetical protein